LKLKQTNATNQHIEKQGNGL